MKRLLSVIIIIIFVCTFAACDVNDPSETSSSTSDADGVAELTVESITELFGEDYNAQEYTSEMIEHVLPNVETAGVVLQGDVTAIVHITKKSSAPEMADWEWAYIYEFTNEADAVAFEENRRAFVNDTEENGQCVRYGFIVVFGSAPIISSIAQ